MCLLPNSAFSDLKLVLTLATVGAFIPQNLTHAVSQCLLTALLLD